MLLKEAAAHLDDVFRFAAIKPDLPDLGLEGFVRQRGEILGRVVFGKEPRVTMLTRLSVLWAERIVATNSSKGVVKLSSHLASGYISASVSRIRRRLSSVRHVHTSSFLGLKDIIGGRPNKPHLPGSCLLQRDAGKLGRRCPLEVLGHRLTDRAQGLGLASVQY